MRSYTPPLLASDRYFVCWTAKEPNAQDHWQWVPSKRAAERLVKAKRKEGFIVSRVEVDR